MKPITSVMELVANFLKEIVPNVALPFTDFVNESKLESDYIKRTRIRPLY